MNNCYSQNEISIDSNLLNTGINYKCIIITCVFGILLIFDLLLSILCNSDVVTLSLWLVFALVIALADLKVFLKYAIFFFHYTTNVIAVYLIENRTFFLTEMDIGTERAGSLFLITAVHWVVITTIMIMDSKSESRLVSLMKNDYQIEKGNDFGEKIELFIATAFIVGCLFCLYKVWNVSAASMQIDRFVFENEYVSGLWKVLHTYLIWLIPILVIIATRGKEIVSVTAITLFFIYMVLAGHKFGVFITVILYFMPYIIEKFKLNKWNMKSLAFVVLFGSVSGCMLLALVYRFNMRTYGSNKEEFYQYIYNRTAQQGQMWWGVFLKEKGKGTHIPEMFNAMGSFYKINPEVIKNKDFGIYKLMKLVIPNSLYEQKLNNYSRYAFSTEASFYYYLKAGGLFFAMIALAVLLVVITNWYWSAIVNKKWFDAIISGRVYYVLLSVFLQSDFNALFSRRILFILFIYTVVKILDTKYIYINKVFNNNYLKTE